MCFFRVPTLQGTLPKIFPVRENREFRNFVKTEGILFAQVVNSLSLKMQDIAIFAANFSIFFPLKLNVFAKSVSQMKLSQIKYKFPTVKFPV